jgi:coproporphyrinogen III oxidase-like Fe-S oxidoreductase
MLGDAIAGFLARGYAYIGMDHFALPGDALAIARREGRLHRNFQGYSTQPDCDLVGLGVSAIGRVGTLLRRTRRRCRSTTRAGRGTAPGGPRLPLDATTCCGATSSWP